MSEGDLLIQDGNSSSTQNSNDGFNTIQEGVHTSTNLGGADETQPRTSSNVPCTDVKKVQKCTRCCISSLSVVICVTAIIVPLLIYTSIVDIRYAAKQKLKSSDYYMVLTTNDTHRLPIDSTKYEAVKLTLQQYHQQKITISPTPEDITSHKTLEYKATKKLSPTHDDINVILMRYWPKGLSVTGKLQCTSTSTLDLTSLAWNWSSIYEGQHEDLDAKIDCSKYREYPGHFSCPAGGWGELDVATILDNRGGNYEVMTLGACAMGVDMANAELNADFKEEHYNTELYPHYSMGPNTDNPDSITVPLTERNRQNYLYITVTGTPEMSHNLEVLVQPILPFSQNEEKKSWLITSIVVKLLASVYISLTCIISLIHFCRNCCKMNN